MQTQLSNHARIGIMTIMEITAMKKYTAELVEQLQHLNEISSNTKMFVEKMVKVIPEKEYVNISAEFIEFQNLHLQVEQLLTEYAGIFEESEKGSNSTEPNSTNLKIFTSLHKIYDGLAAAFNLVSKTFNFVISKNYTTTYTENMSSTFISKVKFDANQIETGITNYFLYTSNQGKQKLVEICAMLAKQLTNAAEEYINQPLTPNFITSVIAQNLIKLGRKHMVLEKLELFKQNSLLSADANKDLPELDKFNFKLAYNGQLSRFNLVPVGEFKPLVSYIGKTDVPAAETWKHIPGVIKAMKNAVILGANSTSIRAFKKLAEFHAADHNLFIIDEEGVVESGLSSSMLSPSQHNTFIEFNMLALIDPDYIKQHEMQTAEKSGLNNRIIRRFETVKEHISSGMPLPFEKKRQVESSEINSEKKSTKHNLAPNLCEILEVLWLGADNFLYRAMSQLDSKGRNPAHKHYAASKTRENNLLEFAAPSRPHLYNKIIENKVIERINPKHREVMEKYMSEPIFIPPKEELREFIKTTADGTFDTLFLSSNNRDKITNLQKMRKFYEDNMDDFAKIAEPAILQYYTYKPDDTARYSHAMQKEANLSLVVVLDMLCDGFARNLRKNIEKMLPTVDKNLFVQYSKPEEIKQQLKGYFLKTIDDTFDVLDAKPSLWEEIEPQLKMFYF